jgi:predicted RNase H-like HicB family nuclease
MTNERSDTVVFERDETGAWVAWVPSVPGCHTYGWSISQTSSRLRDALALWRADAPTARPEFRLPPDVQESIVAAQRSARRAEAAVDHANAALAATVTVLARARFSRRDTAVLLGISHQRVQQILEAR